MDRTRKTANGMSVESRIILSETYFFEVKDLAYEKAREIRSYVYPIYEDIKTNGRSQLTHTGWGVPR